MARTGPGCRWARWLRPMRIIISIGGRRCGGHRTYGQCIAQSHFCLTIYGIAVARPAVTYRQSISGCMDTTGFWARLDTALTCPMRQIRLLLFPMSRSSVERTCSKTKTICFRYDPYLQVIVSIFSLISYRFSYQNTVFH